MEQDFERVYSYFPRLKERRHQQAGTLSGNPMAMAAGTATLSELSPASYQKLEELSAELERGLVEAAKAAGAVVQVNRVGSMLTVFFSEGPVFDAASARKCDTKKFGRFFHAMLERGVALAPGPYEVMFPGLAHDDAVIDSIVAGAERAVAAMG